MNLHQIIKKTNPFEHWEFNDCLDKNSLDEGQTDTLRKLLITTCTSGKLNKSSDISYNKQTMTQELYDKIKEKKADSLDWLHDIPGEFLTILLYCRKLGFDAKPNYNYIRVMLNNLLKR